MNVCILCIHDESIVRFYVFIHVCVCMNLCPFVVCLKQCIVCVSETCGLLLKVYLFVFVLFMDKHV